MSNSYNNMANMAALPPSFFQANPQLANLSMANLQQMGQNFGMDPQAQAQQNMYTQQQPQHTNQQQQHFNMSALANIPLSALDGIQIPGQQQQYMSNQIPKQQPQQQGQPNNFNQTLQAFHRIQAQDGQKSDGQRIPSGAPNAGNNGNAGSQALQNQGPVGQQFLQQMTDLARLQQQQQSRQQGGGANSGGQRGMNGVNMQAVMASMAAQAMGQQQGGQAQGMTQGGQGVNPHSQHQGLQLAQGGAREDDTEVGRRIALQNMLAQTLVPGSQQQQQQSYQQPQQFQNSQSDTQLGPNGMTPNIQPEMLQIMARMPAAQRESLLGKHNGNVAAAIHELTQLHLQRQLALQNMQGQGQSQGQGQGRIPQATNPSQMQQQQPQRQPSQQGQVGVRPGYGHQRSESQQGQPAMPGQVQGQGATSQGQGGQGLNFDPKQFEALQQMKERQQRQSGLITPQMAAGGLVPLLSPQPPNQALAPAMGQPQQQQPFRQTPQSVPAQLPPQQQQQANSQQPQQQQAGNARAQTEDGGRKDLGQMIRQWTDDQLRSHTAGVSKKLANATKEEPSRFYLLTLISDFKRRNLPVPPDAISAMGAMLNSAPALAQVLEANWETIQQFALRSHQQANSTQPQSVNQNQNQYRQTQPTQNQNGTFPPQRQTSGSQTNPIEIVTPKLGSSSALPNTFTPSSQNGQSQSGHHRQPSFNGQNLVPPPPSQQQRSPQPQQQTIQQPLPWGGADFREEPLPFSEAQVWDTLKKLHKRADLPVPTLEGRNLDIYALFVVVHRNGGSHRLDQNMNNWQIIGAHLGFGLNDGTQPPRSSLETANNLRRLYHVYLAQFEQLWYSKLQHIREQQALSSGNAQQSQPNRAPSQSSFTVNTPSAQSNQYPQNANQPTPSQMQQVQALQQQQQFQNLLQQAQQSNQVLPPAVSAQLLESAAKNPGALTEQQRQYIEYVRRTTSAAQGGAGGTPSSTNMALLTPSMSSQLPLPSVPGPNGSNTAAAAMLAAQAQAQQSSQQQQQYIGGAAFMQHAAQSLRGNPQLCLQWIKSKEEQMQSKFPTRFVDVPDAIRPQLLLDLRNLAGAAKDAQEKMPKYQLVAAEKGPEEFAKISGLIQLYMAILITCHHAEQGRFCFPADHIHKLKFQLASLITSANTLYEEYRAGPEGSARIDRLFGGLPKASPRESGPTAGQGASSSNPQLVANMPKGLRVEDLKPPPSKRAKGKVGVNGSPAAPTPEAAKTPASHIGDSPIATSSPAGPAKKGSAKRKRGATVTISKEDKEGGNKESTGLTPAAQMPPPPAPLPIDILPTPAELEAAQHRAFFQARSEVERGESDIYLALSNAVAEYNAALGSAAVEITIVPDTVVSDKDFFAQWIDADQLNDLSTPELYYPGSTDADLDTSPESIKTVPSTNQMPTPLPRVDKGQDGDEGEEEKERRLIEMSPGSMAYNGGLFWEEYDFGVGIDM